MEFGGLTVRTDLYPLVLIVPTDSATLDDYHKYFAYLEDLYRARQPFASIADTRRLTTAPDPRVRSAITEFSKRTEEESKRYCLANYVVVSNVLIQGALRALDWLHKPEVERTFVTTYTEAVKEVMSILEDAEVPISAALRDHVQVSSQRSIAPPRG